MDDVEDQHMEDMAHGRADSLAVVESWAIISPTCLWFVDRLFR